MACEVMVREIIACRVIRHFLECPLLAIQRHWYDRLVGSALSQRAERSDKGSVASTPFVLTRVRKKFCSCRKWLKISRLPERRYFPRASAWAVNSTVVSLVATATEP